MSWIHLLFATHLFGLLGLTLLVVRTAFNDLLTRLCAAFLLVWANVVYTALVLSAFSQLGNRGLYFGLSLSLAWVVWRVVSKRVVSHIDVLPKKGDPLYTTRAEQAFAFFLIATLAVAASCTAIICLRYDAANWDTLAYRFPRVFFYLAHGSVSHFAKGVDFRALTYPFNGSLLYLFLAIYKIDGRSFNLVSVFCWGMAGVGIFQWARAMGGSKLGGLVAAWLCAMAPIILCEGASTNDEVISAAPVVVGALFLFRAFRLWSPWCLILGVLGVALGVGARLHWIFLVPLAILASIALLIYVIVARTGFVTWEKWRARMPAILLAGILALPLIVPFLALNYAADKQFADPGLNDGMNSPFRFDVARQKLRLNSAQLFLAPVPDLVISSNAERRHRVYGDFNDWMARRWFHDVDQSAPFRMPSYHFRGVADPFGDWYFEQTLWLGFLPLLMVFLIARGLLGLRAGVLWVSCLTVLFAWHIAFAVATKYMETIGSYYSYPAVLACAGLGGAWDTIRRRNRAVDKVLLCGFLIVVATHLVIDFNLLAFNVQRNVRAAVEEGFEGENPGVTRISRAAAKAVQHAGSIYIPYTHWEILYWNFMRVNPGATYTTGGDLLAARPGTLTLIHVDPNGQWLIGRAPEAAAPGLTYLGKVSADHLFGKGDGVEKENVPASHFFLVTGRVVREGGGRAISEITLNTDEILGLATDKSTELRVRLEPATGPGWSSSWTAPMNGLHVVRPPAGEKWTNFVMEARSAVDPSVIWEVRQDDLPLSVNVRKQDTTQALTRVVPAN